MATAANDAAFEETAPAAGLETWLAGAKQLPVQPSPRARFWNDFAAMLGCTWGPAAWLLIAPTVAGQWDVFTAVLVNCMFVTSLSAWSLARWPHMRHRIFFAFLLYLGVFDGLIIGVFSPGWLEGPTTGIDMPLPAWSGWAGAAAYFGLCLTLGIALLLAPRWQRAPGVDADSRSDSRGDHAETTD